MYANMLVRVKGPDGWSAEYPAHEVQVKDGRTFVHVDEQDGSGNYAEPGPVHDFGPDHAVEVQADW